jgi:hypothetical protein
MVKGSIPRLRNLRSTTFEGRPSGLEDHPVAAGFKERANTPEKDLRMAQSNKEEFVLS